MKGGDKDIDVLTQIPDLSVPHIITRILVLPASPSFWVDLMYETSQITPQTKSELEFELKDSF